MTQSADVLSMRKVDPMTASVEDILYSTRLGNMLTRVARDQLRLILTDEAWQGPKAPKAPVSPAVAEVMLQIFGPPGDSTGTFTLFHPVYKPLADALAAYEDTAASRGFLARTAWRARICLGASRMIRKLSFPGTLVRSRAMALLIAVRMLRRVEAIGLKNALARSHRSRSRRVRWDEVCWD